MHWPIKRMQGCNPRTKRLIMAHAYSQAIPPHPSKTLSVLPPKETNQIAAVAHFNYEDVCMMVGEASQGGGCP